MRKVTSLIESGLTSDWLRMCKLPTAFFVFSHSYWFLFGAFTFRVWTLFQVSRTQTLGDEQNYQNWLRTLTVRHNRQVQYNMSWKNIAQMLMKKAWDKTTSVWQNNSLVVSGSNTNRRDPQPVKYDVRTKNLNSLKKTIACGNQVTWLSNAADLRPWFHDREQLITNVLFNIYLLSTTLCTNELLLHPLPVWYFGLIRSTRLVLQITLDALKSSLSCWQIFIPV